MLFGGSAALFYRIPASKKGHGYRLLENGYWFVAASAPITLNHFRLTSLEGRFAWLALVLFLVLAVLPVQAQPAPTGASLRAMIVFEVGDAPANARPLVVEAREDRWWARDKLQHFTFSFLWALGSQYVLTDKVGWSDRAALPASAASTAAVGLAKEVYDARFDAGNRFSRRDLVADGAGLALAVVVILL